MKNIKKPTVTVAVIAYNEESNIKNFLQSVLLQNEVGYTLKKIIVVSDGSTDNTISIIKSMKSRKIKLLESKERMGKSFHLNKIYRQLDSDFLVQTDADVTFAHANVIENIIRVFIKNNKVMMCGGNPLPLLPKTFIESAVNITVDVYLKLRKIIKGGHNAFSADGRLLAFRKEFIQTVNIPENMIANDAFVYLVYKNRNLKYRFVEKAQVNFRSPQSIWDQLIQNSRFAAAPIRMRRYFSKGLLKQEYTISKKIYYPLIIKAFLQHPIECIVIFLVNCMCRINAALNESTMNAKWDIAITSKKLSL